MSGRRAAVILLGILAVAILGGFTLTFVLLYLLLLLVVAGYLWTFLNARWIHIRVQGPADRYEAGETLSEEVTVHNHSHLPVLGVVLRERSDLPGHHNIRVLTMPGHSVRNWDIETPCHQRGYFTVGPFDVVTSDPFGIFSRVRTYASVRNVLVYPTTVDLPGFRLVASGDSGHKRNAQVTRRITPSAAWVREYTPGDSMRQIHWRSTARLGKLMVKEFDLDMTDELSIVLDLSGDSQAGRGGESTLEYMVKIAASLARKYIETGVGVGFMALGDKPYRFPAESGTAQLWRLLESMATMKATGTQSVAHMLHHTKDLINPSGYVVVIVTRLDQDLAAAIRNSFQVERTTVVLVDRGSFGEDNQVAVRQESSSLIEEFHHLYLVRKGDRIEDVLASKQSPTTVETH